MTDFNSLTIRLALMLALCTGLQPGLSRAQSAEEFGNLKFRFVGPSRGGRVTAVTGHRAQPGTFYMGATGGGVWKTTDNGHSWRNISDGYFETASIGSIDVADSNPAILYVGTGSDGIRSNVIIGRGIYKSIDGGASWAFMGLRETGQIGAVVVHPTNPDVVFAAALGNPFGPNAERGVYKTIDGGVSWQQVLHVSDRTGAVDLELNPANPDIVYAAMWRAERKPWTIISGDADENGIYVSADAGGTWNRSREGLPDGLTGKIDFAVSPADPSRVYALVEAKPDEEGLYRSNDRGRTWSFVNSAGYLMSRPFYYTNVDADPTDADVVWVNNLGLWKSVNGGIEFERVSTPHGDNHDMWINPDNPLIMVQSNDGGANVTLDGGRTWSTQLNQPTAELYQVDIDNQFPYWVYAGQQDNTTIAVPSIPPDSRPGGPRAYWEAVGGCETGPAVPHPVDASIVYSNCKGTFSRFNRITGQSQRYYVGGVNLYGVNPRELPYRFQRVVPIEISPHDPSVIYHGSQYVHRTRNEGRTWETISGDLTAFRPERQVISGGPITRDITGEEHYSTLYVIEASPVSPDVIWTGANDGPVHVTTDGGQTWKDVTPPDMPPEGRIQTIDPSPHSAAKAYVAGYRYLLGDFRPYIYRTSDYGATWTLLTDGTNGIPPDSPTRVVREDPDRAGLLYAGTEFGLFVSMDDGATWQTFQQGLPVTPVTGIRVHRQDLVVSTMGRGFWILDNVTPLHADLEDVISSDAHLFPVRDAYRMRYRSGRSSETDPEYPPAGVMIDYYFRADQAGDVTLDIINSQGEVIRSYAAESPAPEWVAEQGMRGPPPMRPSAGGLQAAAGMHRFTWNLRHEGLGAPMAVPGTYTVRLSSAQWSMTQTAVVDMDPRVAADKVTQEDLEAQLAFNLEVQQTRIGAREVAERTATLMEQLEGQASSELSEAATRLHDLLVTKQGDSYPPPMLIDQLSYLNNFTSGGDHKPGQDAYDRLAELQSQLSTIESQLEQLERQSAASTTE
ncbi:MAG: hypothetical protein OXU68_15230 [Bacteroidota bacterium]|nr:hypothetical protein [Bacteroidota bacterium]